MPVSEVKSGQTASFALKRIKRSQIRKGMVMVCPKLNPVACWEVIIFLKLHYQYHSYLKLKFALSPVFSRYYGTSPSDHNCYPISGYGKMFSNFMENNFG